MGLCQAIEPDERWDDEKTRQSEGGEERHPFERERKADDVPEGTHETGPEDGSLRMVPDTAPTANSTAIVFACRLASSR